MINNLVKNARQSNPKNKKIKIPATNFNKPLEFIDDKIRSNQSEKFVRINIMDNVKGISQYQLKIFDLYLTTKKRGSGLGLAIV